MKKRSFFIALLCCSTLLLFSLIAGCGKKKPSTKAGTTDPLLCYVGGTMRPAMEELAALYEKKTGQKVLIDYAGSGELLVKMEQTRKGDLYVAHDPFLAAVMKKGIGVNGWTVAGVEPVIVVAKGNPKNITGLVDLAGEGIRLVLTDAQYSTMGHLVPRMAKKKNLWEAIEANVVSRTRGGGAAANAVSVGTADASVVWNAVAHVRADKLDAVQVEPECKLSSDVDAVTTATYGAIDMGFIRVTVATLKYSNAPEAANKFGAYVASPEGSEVWKKHGFLPPRREEDTPASAERTGKQLFVHCAAGMRKPVSAIADRFKQETGTAVQLSYDGTNRLLGQIRLTRSGDIYIAGDADYVDIAAKEGLVASRGTICRFIPVIMVKKGNPDNITSLASLIKKKYRIGQGDPRAAAVGRLTNPILALNNVDTAAWKKNVVLSTPTVNELGVAMKLGTLDAAVVWDCIARQYTDATDIVTIPATKNISPRVEAAVLSFSKNSVTAERFLAYLSSATAVAILTDFGYTVDTKEKNSSTDAQQ